jgi:hypothetical protein
MAMSQKKIARAKAPETPRYRLRLFVSGATPKAREAIANIRTITDRHLEGTPSSNPSCCAANRSSCCLH